MNGKDIVAKNSKEVVMKELRSISIFDAMWEAVIRIKPNYAVFKNLRDSPLPNVLKMLAVDLWVGGPSGWPEEEEFLRNCLKRLNSSTPYFPNNWEDYDDFVAKLRYEEKK